MRFWKKKIAAVVLYFLYGAIYQLYKKDTRVKAEIEDWQEGTVFAISACKNGPVLYLGKKGGRLKRFKNPAKTDVLIEFKSIEIAFVVLTGRMGIAQAYSAHSFYLKGSVNRTMSLVRCVDLAEGYLFPAFMSRHILKEIPKKQLMTIHLYGSIDCGMIGGSYRRRNYD